MAEQRQKDLINRLADVGEEAFTRVAGSPATSRLIESMGGMRERLDDVQKKVLGLDALERRVAELEQRLDDLDKPKAGTPRSRASAPKSAGGSSRSSASDTSGSGTPRPRSSGSGSSGSGTPKKPSS